MTGIVRRWRIRKFQNVWHVYSSPNTIVHTAHWRFVNYYDTFEEARAKTANFVDLYNQARKALDQRNETAES